MVEQPTYEQQLQREGEVWSEYKRHYHEQNAPDWHFLRELTNYWILRHELERFYNRIRENDAILELGCGAGWQALEMARHGAHVVALDIAEGALEIGKAYYEKVSRTEKLTGSVEYHLADVNNLEPFANHYDWIVMSGLLHHMPNPSELLLKSKNLLKPGGGLIILDPLDATFVNSLFIGFFLLVLPTHLSYRDKFRHLLRVRGKAVERMTVAIEGRGQSPFEGVGRTEAPRDMIASQFDIERYHEWGTAGFLAQEVHGPRWLVRNLLRLVAVFDWLLIKVHAIRGLRYFVIAHPKKTL